MNKKKILPFQEKLKESPVEDNNNSIGFQIKLKEMMSPLGRANNLLSLSSSIENGGSEELLEKEGLSENLMEGDEERDGSGLGLDMEKESTKRGLRVSPTSIQPEGIEELKKTPNLSTSNGISTSTSPSLSSSNSQFTHQTTLESLLLKISTLESNLLEIKSSLGQEILELRNELGVVRGCFLEIQTQSLGNGSGSPLVTLSGPSNSTSFNPHSQSHSQSYSQTRSSPSNSSPSNYLHLPSPPNSNSQPSNSPQTSNSAFTSPGSTSSLTSTDPSSTTTTPYASISMSSGINMMTMPQSPLDRIRLLGQEDKDETIRVLMSQLNVQQSLSLSQQGSQASQGFNSSQGLGISSNTNNSSSSNFNPNLTNSNSTQRNSITTSSLLGLNLNISPPPPPANSPPLPLPLPLLTSFSNSSNNSGTSTNRPIHPGVIGSRPPPPPPLPPSSTSPSNGFVSPLMGIGIGMVNLGGRALSSSLSTGIGREVGFGAVGTGSSSPNFEAQSTLLSHSHSGSQSQSHPQSQSQSHPQATWDNGNGNGMSNSSSVMMTNPPGSLGGKWEALGVGMDLFRTISKYGLGPPTKIQSKAIPCMLRNQDIVAQAPSIQERIQSYIVPALQLVFNTLTQSSLNHNGVGGDGGGGGRGIQILIATATVDQAAQASRLAIGLGSALGIRTALCVGSGDISVDLNTFSRSPPHILVGTPSRLLSLFSTGILNMNDVQLLVIDECDQLIARNLSEFVANLVRLLPLPSSTTTTSSSTTSHPDSPTTTNTQSTSPMLTGGSTTPNLPGAFESPTFPSLSRFTSPSPNPPQQQQQQQSSHFFSSPPPLPSFERQTAIFSCTVPQDVLNFASSLNLREPVRVLVRREGGESSSPSVRGLRQYYLYIAVGAGAKLKSLNLGGGGGGGGVAGGGRRELGNTTAREWKLEALADLCEDYSFDHCVIFCSSIESVEACTYKLGTRAIEALALVSDMGQAARHAIMSKFRSSPNSNSNNGGTRMLGPNKRCLVVYDALCRNLTDVHQVSLVINYDLPRAVEDYLHRIVCATASGYGRPGVAINIVTPGTDVDMLRSIERCKISELPPSFASA